MSGLLLQKFCPEEGPRQSQLMWLIIGLSTCVSPVLLTVFWKYISHRDQSDAAKYAPVSKINEEGLPDNCAIGSEPVVLRGNETHKKDAETLDAKSCADCISSQIQ